MRPIAYQQNPLQYPLNEILGTRAQVRLLRVMANEVDGSITVSDAAKRAGLTVPGAQKAISKLNRSGFVSRVGGGRKHQYEIRSSDRLMQIILELFRTEKDRYERLFSAIKAEIKNLRPHPTAAWILAIPGKMGEPITLGLLHETRHLTNCVRQLRSKLNQVENDFDLTIELEGYTQEDISVLKIDDVTLLYGAISSSDHSMQEETRNPLTRREKDRRLNVMSYKLAKAIENDTSLLHRAKDHIDRLLKEDQGTDKNDLMEWRDILRMYSIHRLSLFFTSSSPRANRLRKSNPLFDILNIDK